MQPSDTLQIALFIACVMFLAIDADLLLRHWLLNSSSRKGKIRRLDGKAPILLYRQMAIYAFLVISITWMNGPMAGLAVSMTLAALSIGIETRRTIKALWNWITKVRFGWIRPGTWVPYRSTAAKVEAVSPFEITLRLLTDEVRSFPLDALKLNISRTWSSPDVGLREVSLVVDRHADLLAARGALTRAATQFAPSSGKGFSNIGFRDLSKKRTIVDVSLVSGTTDLQAIKTALGKALHQIGCHVYPTRSTSGLRLVMDGEDRAA